MSDVPQEAVNVLKAFLDASQRNDVAGMSACLTRQSLESAQVHGSPEGVRYVLGESQMEGERAVIAVKGFAQDTPADSPPGMEMACLLVQEEGRWKFDLAGTMERMMGGQIESAMQQVAEGMGQAMEQVGQVL